ncbi:MAG: TonB family protein [Pseudomonadota bacterium]
MKARLITGGAMALTGSVVLHLAGADLFAVEATVALPGGGDVAPARLGTSFADMVRGSAGLNQPQPDEIEPLEPTETEPLELIETETPEHVDTEAAQVEPSATPQPEPSETQSPDTTRTEPLTPDTLTGQTPPATQSPVQITANETTASDAGSTVAVIPVPVAPSRAIVPDIPSATISSDTAPETAPEPPVTSVAPISATEQVTATSPDVQTPDASTPRPQTRPDPNATPAPTPGAAPQQPRPPPASPGATGNASTDATRGQETATETGQTTSQSPQNNSASQAGQAALPNYGATVFRRIARNVGRFRGQIAQDAVVTLTIAASGALQSVSLSRSSGNPDFDQRVVSAVQRAAPFPPTPTGVAEGFRLAFGTR